jgi:predicted transcriptional regulator
MPKRSSIATVKRKNPAAVALGRLGGLKGGKARAAKLSAKRRSAIARNAVIARLEQKIIALETSKLNRLEPLKNFISEANTAQKWVKEENWMEMKSFLQKVGSNRLLRAQTLTVTFKKPASLLAETVLAVESSTLESERSSRWWRRRELNPRP